MSKNWTAPRKVGAAAIGLAALAGGVVVNPTPAAAAYGWVQVFKHADYQGGSAWLAGDDNDYTNDWFPDGTKVNDNVSSIINHSSWDMCFYEHVAWGRGFKVRAGYRVDLRNSFYNDRISAHYIGPCDF